MVFEQIEQLKLQYTDKYVVVDETRPELRRFKGQTGTIRTVNMSGRALVEFDAHDNIGWYDIELDFLRVIDKPLPKPEKPAAKKAAKPAAKKAAPAEKKTGGGMSVEEMLAAARGEKGAAPAAKPAAAKAEAPAAAKPAAKKPGAMSVEEMLAAARGEKSAAAPAAAAAAPESAAPEPPAPEPPAKAEAPAAAAGPLPTSVDDIVAFCRKADG
jgi:hypothetical protein